MPLSDLPTLGEQQAKWFGKPIPKGPSQRELNDAEDRDEKKAEAAWKKAIWKRDESQCRVCEREVKRSMKRISGRGEVHHIASRADKTVRWDPRNGLLTCAKCHDRLERNEVVILATGKQMFVENGKSYIDGRCRLKFKETKG